MFGTGVGHTVDWSTDNSLGGLGYSSRASFFGGRACFALGDFWNDGGFLGGGRSNSSGHFGGNKRSRGGCACKAAKTGLFDRGGRSETIDGTLKLICSYPKTIDILCGDGTFGESKSNSSGKNQNNKDYR